ncbi:MAG: hypothetical protein HY785_27455 [Oscillatoriophycideae cyanobacterium NC_groundwater_1537_Pr4_S-0.65um_50_18]|nr:hypothetical protein [Oscillatoriophycideae cyanobacterium NC_groundwater_1537_Pr4_S-0.65um_50_18]
MKPELKRIEATLGQLNPSISIRQVPTDAQRCVSSPSQNLRQPQTLQAFPLPQDSANPVAIAPSHPTPLGNSSAAPTTRPAPATPPASARAFPVQAFPVQGNPKTPSLPRSKPPSISSHRHAANPNLAVSLLKEIEAKISVWQQELEQVIQQMRSLYEEGPIVDGWLESHALGGTPQAMPSVQLATLRHAEVDRLMDYIEEICSTKTTPPEEAIGTSYRLCGLDTDGQLWSRPCPAPQIPYISLAIARYQKLRILLDKKQVLENRLQQLVQTLTLLHRQLEG